MQPKEIIKNAELVIFDFFNTLAIDINGELRLRDSAFSTLATLRSQGKKSAISSTSPLDEITKCYPFLHISTLVNGIYGQEHVIKENGYAYKDLGRICREHRTEPDKAVLIDDNHKDIGRNSAERFNVQLIIVPDGYTSPEYDLTSLIN